MDRHTPGPGTGLTADPPRAEHHRPVLGGGPLGVQHFINPKPIAGAADMVMLSAWGRLVRWLAVTACLFAAFLGLYLLIDGVYGVGAGPVRTLLELAAHPLAGLVIGVLVTALVQSSTATTALTIAAVATGSVTVPVAVPVIIGANIGTTVTPLLASFSYTGDRAGFGRAFSTASLHCWFNLILAVVFFGVELAAHPLERLSGAVAAGLTDAGTEHIDAARITVAGLLQPLVDAVGTSGLAGRLFGADAGGAVCIAVGAALSLTALRVMGGQLRVLFAATTRSLFERLFGAHYAGGFLVGLAGTAVVQASALTIATLLPFAATDTLRRREAFAVILGANVGTTISGLVAAMAVPGAYGVFGLQAALVHVLFNVGTALLALLPPVRGLIGRLAGLSARRARTGYVSAFVVTLALFYLLPAVVYALLAVF